MFICKDCLDKTFRNEFISVSVGPCESCGKTKMCDDVHPSQLVGKDELVDPDTRMSLKKRSEE